MVPGCDAGSGQAAVDEHLGLVSADPGFGRSKDVVAQSAAGAADAAFLAVAAEDSGVGNAEAVAETAGFVEESAGHEESLGTAVLGGAETALAQTVLAGGAAGNQVEGQSPLAGSQAGWFGRASSRPRPPQGTSPCVRQDLCAAAVGEAECSLEAHFPTNHRLRVGRPEMRDLCTSHIHFSLAAAAAAVGTAVVAAAVERKTRQMKLERFWRRAAGGCSASAPQ